MSSQAGTDEDLAFARLLLDAGRAEPLPSASTAAALVTFAAGAAAFRGHELGSGAATGTTVGAAGWAGRWAVKWVLLGAVVGSAATLVWLRQATPARERPSAAVAALSPAPVAPATTAEAAVAPNGIAQAGTRNDEAKLPVASPSVPLRRSARARPDLAAEVAALDGIRTALAIGAWRDAELQLTRYRREFPGGALRNEAEVLSITSLLAQGRKQAAASAAKTFLAAHPRDPQAARVHALMGSEASRPPR